MTYPLFLRYACELLHDEVEALRFLSSYKHLYEHRHKAELDLVATAAGLDGAASNVRTAQRLVPA